MNDYTVVIEVSITADDPQQAAKWAMEDLRDPSLGPWNVEVFQPGTTVCVEDA